MTFRLVNGKWVQDGQLNPPNPNLQQPVPVPPLNLDALYKKYNEDVVAWQKENKKTANIMPPDSWLKPRQALLQGQIEAQTTARQEIVDRNNVIMSQNFDMKQTFADNAREDKYRQAQLDLQRAAAGTAAATRAQERLDALAKEKRDRAAEVAAEARAQQQQVDAEKRQIAREDALAAETRLRGIAGGNAAADYLFSQAGKRTTEGLIRIKELYDPMKSMADSEFATQLELLANDFKTARGQVTGAGEDFLKNFVDSVAYKDVPISTLEAPTNPLLAALQSQGAGTGEVQAVSDFAKQFATSTSDLGKWAASQLNVGQQNFDIASKRAATGATTAALQGLAGQEPRIKAGMQADLNKRLQDIALQKAQASESVYARQATQEDSAAAIKAQTMAQYGYVPPKDEPKKEEPKKDEKPVDFRREIDNAYASKEAAYTKGGLDPNQAAINNAAAEKAAADKAKEEAAARAAGIAAREAARR